MIWSNGFFGPFPSVDDEYIGPDRDEEYDQKGGDTWLCLSVQDTE